MSTIKNWFWSSLANWLRILTNILVQLLLVPVLLSKWGLEELAAWLLVSAVMPYATALDIGHQNFLAYDFMAAGGDCRKVGTAFRASILPAICLGGIQSTVLAIVTFFTPLRESLWNAGGAGYGAALLLILQLVAWLSCGNIGGIMARAIVPFGYLPRTLWWSLGLGIVTGSCPIVVAALDGTFTEAAWVAFAAIMIFNLLMIVDFRRIMLREGIIGWSGDRPLPLSGFGKAVKGVMLSGRDMLLQVRQQGIRLILAPTVGLAAMGSFATTRTASNITLQGLTSILAPVEPDAMRYMRLKDTARLGTIFWIVWSFCAIVLTSALLVIQFAMPYIFPIWTHGRVAYNAPLFALLSSSILFFGASQPALFIVKGNNMIRPQLMMSAVGAVVVVGLIALLQSQLGIIAAGLGLLAAEIVSYLVSSYIAREWFKANGLLWPNMFEFQSMLLIVAVSVGLLAIAYYPSSTFTTTLTCSCIIIGGSIYIAYNSPSALRMKIEDINACWKQVRAAKHSST